eukprot:jgi/Botrbrau1/16764/Bobra.150_2s0001.2
MPSLYLSAVLPGLLLLQLSIVNARHEAQKGLCTVSPSGAFQNDTRITVWNQEVMPAFGSSFRPALGAKPSVEGPWMAPIITSLVLFGQTGYMLIKRPQGKGLMDLSLRYWLLAIYPTTTGIVELVRANFDTSRFGFVTATLHNLPEYGLLLFIFLDADTPVKAWPLTLLWVWLVDQWILFIPSLDGVHSGLFFAGLAAQVTGIVCDFALLFSFYHLGKEESKSSKKKALYMSGLLGAVFHLLEIFPLLVLLAGLTPRPFLPISIIVAVTEPLTYYFYTKLATAWEEDGEMQKKKRIPLRESLKLLLLSALVGWFLIFAPPLIFKPCHSGPLSAPSPAPMSEPSHNTTQNCPIPHGPPAPAASPKLYTLCQSSLWKTWTSSFVPIPGHEKKLASMVATTPGPVSEEEGNIQYQLSIDVDNNGRIRFFEIWSNIRTFLLHVLMSPSAEMVGKPQVQRSVLARDFDGLRPVRFPAKFLHSHLHERSSVGC